MRRFLVQVIVLALAVAATIGLLSLITIDGVPLLDIERSEDPALELDLSIGFLELDLGLGILMALLIRVQPILMAVLFGRWYLRHPVPSLIIVNGVVFLTVATVAGATGIHFVTPQPEILWLFIDSMAFAAVYVLLDVVFGFNRPHLGDKPRHHTIWARLDRLPVSNGNMLLQNLRLFEVWSTITGFGRDIALGTTPLRHLRTIGDRLSGTRSLSLDDQSAPAKMRIMLQQLGPTYVKLGQMVASRRELLSPAWASELEKLQNDVPPFPWPVAAAIIEQELSKPPSELFASISETPLAAASLGQAHRATLHDGRPVVVKIQRPEIQARVHADLAVIEELAGVAEDRFAAFRRMGVREIVEEFAAGVREELDYSIEAYNARRLADVLSTVPGVDVPVVYPELSSRRVLVMDFVVGVKATRIDKLEATVDRPAVARALVSALIKQLLLDGFFHGDPHPGNVLLDPATGRVTFLDLGLMGELQTQQRLDLMALVWALRVEEAAMLANVVRRLCRPVGPVDEDAYRAGMDRIFNRAWRYGTGDFSAVMLSVFDLLGRENLRMDRELVLAVKALTQAQELIAAIDPDLPLITVIVDEAKGLVGAQITAMTDLAKTGDVADLVRMLGPRAAPVLGQRLLPEQLSAIMGLAGAVTAETAGVSSAASPSGVAGAATAGERPARIATAVALGGVCIAAAILTGTGDVGGPRDTEALRWLALGTAVATGGGSILLARRWSRLDPADRDGGASRGRAR